MLPLIQGVRLSEENGSVRVSGRNLVPINVEPEEIPQLEAVHLGQTDDHLALAVKDLADHKWTVLQMRLAMDGAQVDRYALYRFANGTKRNGRMAVRPPGQRQPIDIRSAETVYALSYFFGSGEDHGLARPGLAAGLKELGQDFRFHPDGVDAQKMTPFKAYDQVVEQSHKLVWVSREGGPQVPFRPEVLEQPDLLKERYELASKVELPANLSAREKAELWEAGYAGRDPENRLRCLARIITVAPLKEAVGLYDSVLANFDPQESMRATDVLVDLSRSHGTKLAAESLPLIAIPVEGETLEDRAELFHEIAHGPAGSPGATPLDRRIDYVRGAIQRFAENDPAAARARLSNIFVLERNSEQKPPAAIGTNEGRLVIGGVLVRGKRPGE